MDLQHETLNHSREIFKNNEVICHFFSDKPNNLPGDRTSRHQVLDTGVTALPISSLNLIIVANSKIIITFATCDLKTIKLIILNPEIGSIVTGNGQKTSLTYDIFSYHARTIEGLKPHLKPGKLDYYSAICTIQMQNTKIP